MATRVVSSSTRQATSTAAQKKRPITRNRESLSCAACRSKKLKCDRKQPCTSCARRQEPELCVYGKSDRTAPNQGREDRVTRGEARLQHLEAIVRDYLQERSAASGSPPSPNARSPRPGDLLTPPGQTFYVGSTHYSAILDDIEELRQVLVEETDPEGSSVSSRSDGETFEGDVLFGHAKCYSLRDILTKYLPAKREVDRCLAAYFRAEAISAPFIHVPQFWRQYKQFWINPQAANPLWVSMLFSVCRLSASVGHEIPPDVTPGGQQPRFLEGAAQCLALGGYFRPQRFAIEAGMLFLQAKITSCLEAPHELGVVFSTVIRVAYTMGYHRDPDHFKHLTPFEGEMRRRTWWLILQLDLLHSFGLGLPNNVQAGTWNTRPPRNLVDTDFDETTPILPPSRPTTEATKIMFYLVKGGLMSVFDKIMKHALSSSCAPTASSEAELIALDTELRAHYAAIPSELTKSDAPLSESIGDPFFTIVTRKCTSILFHECICVLHRPYVTRGRVASILACAESGAAIVRSVLDLYPETQPGGQFFANRWVFSTITWHEFLLGIMVLSLVVVTTAGEPASPAAAAAADVDIQPLLSLLRASHDVCRDKCTESSEARRTCRLLESVLARDWAVKARETEDASMMRAVQSQQAPLLANGTETPSMVDWTGVDMWTGMETWDPMSNVFDTAEWAYLESCLNTNFYPE